MCYHKSFFGMKNKDNLVMIHTLITELMLLTFLIFILHISRTYVKCVSFELSFYWDVLSAY